MRIIPKTDEQIAKEGLMPEGVYGFEVMEGLDEVSKAGNDMIHLKLKVFDGDGGFRYVDDYLLEAMAAKLKRCMDVCGLSAEYQNGTFCGADFVGKTGEVKIFIQEPKDKNFDPRNAVKSYILPKDGIAPVTRSASPARKPAMAGAADDPFGDEIPF